MMSVSVLSVVHRQADKIMLSKLLPVGMFAYYAFASGMISQATLLTGAIAQAALPAFSAALAAGNRPEAQARYRRLHDLLCIASVPIFTAILFAARPFLTYLFNAQVAHQLLLPMAFLCLGSYMNATLTIPSVHIIASGKADIIARSNFLALFTVLPATAALIMVFGLAGAGFSWFLYHLFMYAYFVPRACLEYLDISAGEWYKQVVRILAVAAGTYGPAWILLGALKTQPVPALAVAYVGASVAFLAAAYITIPRERRVKLLRWPYALREAP
jgi:O-antigen/teichoic acid export membrane protein